VYTVAAAMEPVEGAFFSPADLAEPFQLDLSKKPQAKWDRLMANLHSLQGLRVDSDRVGRAGVPADHAQRFAARTSLHLSAPTSFSSKSNGPNVDIRLWADCC